MSRLQRRWRRTMRGTGDDRLSTQGKQRAGGKADTGAISRVKHVASLWIVTSWIAIIVGGAYAFHLNGMERQRAIRGACLSENRTRSAVQDILTDPRIIPNDSDLRRPGGVVEIALEKLTPRRCPPEPGGILGTGL